MLAELQFQQKESSTLRLQTSDVLKTFAKLLALQRSNDNSRRNFFDIAFHI